MMEYVLILAFYAGTLSGGDSVSLATITFQSSVECEAAGVASKKLETLKKSFTFVCVPRRKP